MTSQGFMLGKLWKNCRNQWNWISHHLCQAGFRGDTIAKIYLFTASGQTGTISRTILHSSIPGSSLPTKTPSRRACFPKADTCAGRRCFWSGVSRWSGWLTLSPPLIFAYLLLIVLAFVSKLGYFLCKEKFTLWRLVRWSGKETNFERFWRKKGFR